MPVAASGVTRAVKVTLCPKTDGLRLLVMTRRRGRLVDDLDERRAAAPGEDRRAAVDGDDVVASGRQRGGRVGRPPLRVERPDATDVDAVDVELDGAGRDAGAGDRATVAVKVMFWPRFADGFRLLVTTVVVGAAAGPTVWVSVGLVLAR